MSSKTFLVNNYNKRLTELTYNNIDNWPKTPEYRTFNNKSLIFNPNTDIDLKVRNFKGDYISGAYDPVLVNNIDPANGMEMFDSDTQYNISFIQKHGCLTIRNQSGFLEHDYNSDTERLFNYIKSFTNTDDNLLQTLDNTYNTNTCYLLDIGCIMSSENLPISLNPYIEYDSFYTVECFEYNILEFYLENDSIVCSKRDFYRDENGEKSDYIVNGINGICLIALVFKLDHNYRRIYESDVESFLSYLERFNSVSIPSSYSPKNQYPSLGSSIYSYNTSFTSSIDVKSYYINQGNPSYAKIRIPFSQQYTLPFDVFIDLSEIDSLPEFEGHVISNYKDKPTALKNLYGYNLSNLLKVIIFHVTDYFKQIKYGIFNITGGGTSRAYIGGSGHYSGVYGRISPINMDKTADLITDYKTATIKDSEHYSAGKAYDFTLSNYSNYLSYNSIDPLYDWYCMFVYYT